MDRFNQITVLIAAVLILFVPVMLTAGDLAPPAGEPSPTMHTLEDIYNAVTVGCPSGGCSSGGVPKTGQTKCYDVAGTEITCTDTGQDGDLRPGVEWPNPRFTDNSDGTVKDNLTGLIWLKNANCISSNYPGFDNDYTTGDGRVEWQHALDFVAGINDGTYPNCGGSHADWRLPSRFELESLLDLDYSYPAISNTTGTAQWTEGNPFTGVQSHYYWSGTTYAHGTGYAWGVYMYDGYVYNGNKALDYYVWPVRGDN